MLWLRASVIAFVLLILILSDTVSAKKGRKFKNKNRNKLNKKNNQKIDSELNADGKAGEDKEKKLKAIGKLKANFEKRKRRKKVVLSEQEGDFHYQGDIRLRGDKGKSGSGTFRNALYSTSTEKWPNGIVPYYIPPGIYGSTEENTIQRAMRKIEENTCVKYVPYRNEANYLEFMNEDGEGCYSLVGRDRGQNIISLEDNDKRTCLDYDTVIHEMLHSLGLWHEHMRYDRNGYVSINFENVKPGAEEQFDLVSRSESTTYNVPYDYKSVMHYRSTAFSKNGEATIVPKNRRYTNIIGEVQDASPNDFAKINKIYNCDPNNIGGGIVTKKPGESCSTSDTCSGGSTCRFGTCACPAGQAINGVTCSQNLAYPGQSCSDGAQCVGGSVCNGYSCRCPTGYAVSGQQCVLSGSNGGSSPPYGRCGNRQSCTGGSSCNGFQCVCAQGQKVQNNKCTAGTAAPGETCLNGQSCTGGSYCLYYTRKCACPEGQESVFGTCQAPQTFCKDKAASEICRNYRSLCYASFMKDEYCPATCGNCGNAFLGRQ